MKGKNRRVLVKAIIVFLSIFSVTINKEIRNVMPNENSKLFFNNIDPILQALTDNVNKAYD